MLIGSCLLSGGVDGARPCVTGSNCGIGCLDWGSRGLKVTKQDIIEDKKLNYVRQWVEPGG